MLSEHNFTTRNHRANQKKTSNRFIVNFASSTDEILTCQRLRYNVFSSETGAQFEYPDSMLDVDQDRFDIYCQHLQVYDTMTGEIVGTARLLLEDQTVQSGGFYSEQEFDLGALLPLPGRVLEIGRTCVHPSYRRGPTISMLWAGLAQFIAIHKIDFMIGCACIPLSEGYHKVYAALNYIRQNHPAPIHLEVEPFYPFPLNEDEDVAAEKLAIPSLLNAYLRLGANICSDPCMDPDFNTVDMFIFLDVDNLNARYKQYGSSRECMHSLRQR